MVKAVKVPAENPVLKRAAVLTALNGDAEVAVRERHPMPSPYKAISQAIDGLVKENERLRLTITELESRLAVSDDLVSQLRKALAREEARSSRKRDPLRP